MPLLDHFHPPISARFHWESLFSGWLTHLADELNDHWLPPQLLASEYIFRTNRREIEVASFDEPSAWLPPGAPNTLPFEFPDTFEVRVTKTTFGNPSVAVIKLVSPENKNRPETRQAFAVNCANYLSQGVALVVLDIVTSCRANLYNHALGVLRVSDEWYLPGEVELYAAAFRPVLRQQRPEVDVWTSPCGIGQPIPTLPLRLTGDTFVPVEFESTYQATCRSRRII